MDGRHTHEIKFNNRIINRAIPWSIALLYHF